jgi:glycosyltransferase involved in cell wall biosynthesis
MFLQHRIAVVVPCHGVAALLPDVLRPMPAIVDHVIVVDDGSRDDVATAVAAVGDPRVEVVRHATNRGLGAAMATGYERALALGADAVVKMDGDDQMDHGELPRLLAPLVAGDADLVKGNRFLRRAHLAGMPVVRRAGNLALSFLTKVASGYWNVFDPTNGFVVVRRQVLEEIDRTRLGPGYFFETSLLCEAYLAGAVARDVSIPARYGRESSRLSPGRTLVAFPPLLLRAFVRRIAFQHFVRDFTPVALFLVAGAGLTAWGAAFGLHEWFTRAGTGQPTPTGTIVLALLPLVVGLQLLLQAVVMDIGSVPSRSPWRTPDR